NKNDMSKFVGLKGKWDSSLLTRDLIVCSVVLVGGIWLTYEHLLRGHQEDVTYQ
nr:6K2 [Hippeastrum mosaic virus]